jgi:Cu(I)/Ag(I) efflux system membrane fusion protein
VASSKKSHAKPGELFESHQPETHRGEGGIEAIDFVHATITLTHGPIASLNWPSMLMDFRVADPTLLRSLKPGQKVAFEITEGTAGEYVIVSISPLHNGAASGRHGRQ